VNDGRWDHQPRCSIWYDAQSFPIALILQSEEGGGWQMRWINAGKPEIELGTDRDSAINRATQLIRESVHGKP
jgi:hypothetical protein